MASGLFVGPPASRAAPRQESWRTVAKLSLGEDNCTLVTAFRPEAEPIARKPSGSRKSFLVLVETLAMALFKAP